MFGGDFMVKADRQLAKEYQEAFNKSFFDRNRSAYMRVSEFNIQPGVQYNTTTLLYFVGKDTIDTDLSVTRKCDFVEALLWMKSVMKHPFIPRYISLVYYPNRVVYIYDLYDRYEEYLALTGRESFMTAFSKVFDANYKDNPRQYTISDDSVESLVRRFRRHYSCLNTDANDESKAFGGQKTVDLTKYSAGDFARHLNWNESAAVSLYDVNGFRGIRIRHIDDSGYRSPSSICREGQLIKASDVRKNASKSSHNVLKNPVSIYKYLKSKVYKQDDYCRWASSVVYNHVHGVPSVYMVSGPSGCGKTHLWECIREIYDKVTILDASTVTNAGFKGYNIDQMMEAVEYDDGIVVFDEFDKLCTPCFGSSNTNYSYVTQSNFLKIIDEGVMQRNAKDGYEAKAELRSTKKMTFILCGSFGAKADEIAKKSSGGTIGFIKSESSKVKSYDNDITINDAIEYGMMKELASRVIDMVCVRPLTLKDYVDFIDTKAGNSVVKQIEDKYGYKVKVSKKMKTDIAKSAYDSGLGLRNVINRLRSKIDSNILEQWDSLKQTGVMVL